MKTPVTWTADVSRRLIIAFIISGFSFTVCEATTVITVVDEGRILIGADSLFRGSISGRDLRCKIDTTKPACTVVVVGLRTKQETGFDSTVLAREACQPGVSLTTVANSFGDAAREPLKQAMNYSRLHDPVVYDRDYRGKAPLEVVFAGFRDNKPMVAIKSFLLDEQDRLSDGSPIQIPNDAGNNIVLSGQNDAAKAFLSLNPDWPSLRFPELISELIRQEIVDRPDSVGGPISILEITQTEHRWLQTGRCSEGH